MAIQTTQKTVETPARITSPFWNFVKRNATIFVLVVMVIIMGIIKPIFLRPENLVNVLRQVSIIGTISMGMTFVIITAGIDLSVGAILGLAGVVVAMLGKYGIFATLLVGMIVGAVFGFLNGLITHKFNMQPFIVTLSCMSITRGIAFLLSNGHPVLLGDAGSKFRTIGFGYVGPMPVLVVFWLVVTGICLVLMRSSKFGRYVKAIGGNQEAAFLTGVNVSLVKISAYTLCGTLSGLAGFLMTAYFSSGMPVAGTGFELDAIASVVIGGTSLAGGKGTIVGTIAGVLLFGMLSNIFNLLNVSSYIQMVAKGILILLAVYAAGRSTTS